MAEAAEFAGFDVHHVSALRRVQKRLHWRQLVFVGWMVLFVGLYVGVTQ